MLQVGTLFFSEETSNDGNHNIIRWPKTMTKQKRTKLLIDPTIQFGLIKRAIAYWFMGLLAFSGPIFLFDIHPGSLNEPGSWSLLRPVLITGVAMLPIVIYSVLKHSNKIVGPMLRLRTAMQQLARGERIAPINVRKGDFWNDFVKDFNALVEAIEKRSESSTSSEQNEFAEETSTV